MGIPEIETIMAAVSGLAGLAVPIIIFAALVSAARSASKRRQAKEKTSPNPNGNIPQKPDRSAQPRAKKYSSKEHTHDKLNGSSYNPNETPAEHYLKQLDSFKAAGLVDSKEYAILKSRYSQY